MEGKKCFRCQRNAYLNQNLCEEHYRSFHELPPVFSKIKERELRDVIIHYITLLSLPHPPEIFYIKQLQKDIRLFPDLRFSLDHGKTLILIEIDEYKHKGYKSMVEEDRNNKLLAFFKESIFERMLIIRINPDEYTNHPPIWTKSTKCISPGIEKEIITKNNDEWNYRTKVILILLENIITKKTYNNITNEIIHIKLFF
jgi:hypothetical protein